jgi:hypothetical protein
VKPPPERDVGHREERHPQADVAGETGAGLTPEAASPGREQPAPERDDARQEGEGDDEIDGENQQVLRLGEEAPVEPPARHAAGRRGCPEEADAGAARTRRTGVVPPRRGQAVERAVEVAEAPQLLAHRVDGRERRPVAAHQGRQRPLKR